MENEYPINTVVFEYEQNGKILHGNSSSTTSKDDAILHGLKALEELQQESPYPFKMLRIYSEWKPSLQIQQLLQQKFPNVELTYSFEEGDEAKFETAMKKLYEKKWWQFWK